MNRLLLILTILLVIVSCKKEDKPPVVGTNENGEELVVNETGDTVIYTPPTEEKSEIEVQEEKEEKLEAAIKKTNDGTFDFELNLQKGETYPFKISTSSSTTESDGENSRTITQESTTSLDYVVTEVKPNSFVMDVTYKKFSENISDGKQSMGFDTSKGEPAEEPFKIRWKFNKAVVGKTFSMEVNREGKVENVTNLYKVREQVKNAMKSDLKEEELKALDGLLASALSDEAMKAMFEESMAFYPKKPVKTGDTWDRTESQGSAKSTVNYTLENVDDNVATIKVSGNSSGSDSQTDPNGSGMKLFRSLEGKVTGTVKISAKTGWIENAEMNKSETIRITQEFNGQKANFSSVTKSKSKIN